MLRLPLHSSPLCRHPLDFAHVAMVYGGHLTIVPCNRDRVPTYFGDTAAVIGIASPINAAALLETLRFRDRHGAPPIAWHRANITGSSLSPLSLCLLKTSTGAGRIRRRAVALRPCGGSVPPRVHRWSPVICSPSECVERERDLCRLLRKAANRGAGNCVPSRPR